MISKNNDPRQTFWLKYVLIIYTDEDHGCLLNAKCYAELVRFCGTAGW